MPLPITACVFTKKPYNLENMGQNKAGLLFKRPFWKWLVLLAVGLLFIGWLLNTPEGLLGKADAIGYAVCHRIDIRSFHLGVRQLPLCARCTGMYLGAMLGLAYQQVLGRRRGGTPPWPVLVVLGLFVAAFGVDGVNSYLHLFQGAPSLYEPQNWLRLLTGTGMGLVISAAVFPAFNQTIWNDWIDRPALPDLRSLGGLVLLALVIDGIVLTQNPILLYPLALISAAGVLVLLTMIYALILTMIFRVENHFTSITQLALPLVGGFGMALVQIALLDWVRFVLTGTWAGFQLG
jgi:uncharacterized membrane protein